ncbi:MAG: TrbC/VirB2 family protein [Alphaproteobacteria bacterium]
MTSYKNINMIRIITFSFFCIVFITLSSPEAHAAASGGGGGGALFGSLTNFLNALQDLLTGTWARIIAIIAVVILGFGWMTGRISWYIAGSVIGGIILVFGAAAIVDSISGSI